SCETWTALVRVRLRHWAWPDPRGCPYSGPALVIPFRARALLRGLPAVERFARAILRGVHSVVVIRPLRGQLDDITIRIAEVDRVDHRVIRDAARLDTGALALG